MAWLPVALVLLVLIFYGLSRIFGKSRAGKKDMEAEARQEAADIKTAADALLEKELTALKEDRNELEYIKEIKNDENRLRALADFGNRRRRR